MNPSRVRTAAVLGLAALSAPLLAWRTIEPARKWVPEDLPIEFYVSTEEEETLEVTETYTTLSLTDAAFAHWEDVPCSDMRAEYAGGIENDASGYDGDSRTEIKINDLGNDLGSGTLAATVTYYNGNTVTYNGATYLTITAFDIVFNDGVNFGTPDEIYSPGCQAETSFEAVATHEIGHGLGLGHSCESDEACIDPTLRDAVMYWSIGGCETGREVPNEDDVNGLNALYGVLTDFEVVVPEGSSDAEVRTGKVPLTVTFTVPDEIAGDITSYSWNFGDGSPAATSRTVDHTYESEGQFNVTLTVTGNNQDCGEYTDSARKVGYVVACDPPTPSFTYTNLGDGRVQFENTSRQGAYGCTLEYRWDFGDGESLATFEPTHTYASTGTYTASLTSSGPGGEETYEVEVEATEGAEPQEQGCASSCSTAGAPGGAATGLPLAAVAVAVLAGRRRARPS